MASFQDQATAKTQGGNPSADTGMSGQKQDYGDKGKLTPSIHIYHNWS